MYFGKFTAAVPHTHTHTPPTQPIWRRGNEAEGPELRLVPDRWEMTSLDGSRNDGENQPKS